MSEQQPLGILLDPLFAGVTRPAMAMGVTYSALLINGMTTVELFLLTKNLLWMLVCIPIHGIFWLVCKNDARFFDLLFLWGRTRGPGLIGNARFWKANSYSPLRFDFPNSAGRRRWLWGETLKRQ
ncbi:MAG: type IV secretion system protein VirB3 [Candidatus Binataceae bacterium]